MAAILQPGTLHYGMQLPIQSQSKLYAEDWEENSGPAELARIAQACDRAGFAYIAVCDHTAIPRDLAGAMGTEWWDTMTTLGWLAGITENVRLVSHVAILAYRHPLITAKAFATLDRISGGRAIVGAGAGHVQREFETLGRDFSTRGKDLNDALELLDVALREEWVTFENASFKVEDMGLRPRPVQTPRPPIWIGGSAGAALRRVAKYGDGWLPQGNPRETYPNQIAELRRMREEFGRGDEPMDIGAITEILYVGDAGWDVGAHTLSGAPEKIAESLRWYGEQGANQIQVRFRSRTADELVDQIEAFGAQVAPLLND